jgi:hypothetical protein
MKEQKGAWIFLSHSNKDWDAVRKIRNILEEMGHKPLLFFLKCLEDDPELDSLIKREIESRSWFLLCDSKNARESKWVRSEVAYIKSLDGKVYKTIDLAGSIDSQIECVNILSKRITVFISYENSDKYIAKKIYKRLKDNDYSVWDYSDAEAGESWMQIISSAIDKAAKRGFVLVLLSKMSVKSHHVASEIKLALNKARDIAYEGSIIPIMLDSPYAIQNAMPPLLQFLLGGLQWIDFSKGDFDQNVQKLVAQMKAQPME